VRLKDADISNFRCIDNTGRFSFEQVTCLVGKNESGKTTILHALERLNSYDPSHAEYNITNDYPRTHLSDYDERHPDEPAQVLATTWTLEEEEHCYIRAGFRKRLPYEQ
jgi:predicted ATP-dependent endonuclease of OLD family